ncbi:MAG: hypothetical protein NVSMB23_26840 [Myxococcales bacterium]
MRTAVIAPLPGRCIKNVRPPAAEKEGPARGLCYSYPHPPIERENAVPRRSRRAPARRVA